MSINQTNLMAMSKNSTTDILDKNYGKSLNNGKLNLHLKKDRSRNINIMDSERAQNREHFKFKIDNSRFNSFDKHIQGGTTYSSRTSNKIN